MTNITFGGVKEDGDYFLVELERAEIIFGGGKEGEYIFKLE